MQPRSATDVLEQEFLETRCKILDLAAALDRLDPAGGRDQIAADPRVEQLQKAVAALQTKGTDRAEQVQLIFSDPYDPDWQRDGNGTGSPRVSS